MTDEPNARERTGSDYILDALVAEGVTELFGLIGEGNAALLDALHEHDLPFNQARHEQVAVMMADGYARVSGSVGVCTLTHGPGVTHGATGIACADRDNVPMVILIGDTNFEGRETSLQYLDHQTLTSPITVYGTRIETPETIPEILRRAFDKARMERGPVIVEIPGDIQSGPEPDRPYQPKRRDPQRPAPDRDRVEDAAGLLAAADRPAIVAGGGATASGAGDAIASLAERIGAPIATTFYAKGILSESHPFVSGIAGTFMTPANHELLDSADVVLAIGTQLSGKATRFGAMYADATLIQIDIDHGAMGTHLDPDLEIVADARTAVEALLDVVDADQDRAARVRSAIAEADRPEDLPVETDPNRIDPRALTVALADRLPDEITITVDSGNNTGFPPVFHRLEGDGRMLVNGNFGSMGYALPAALGAQIATPDRPVLCYIGDGAFMQVIQDLETAVRLALPIIIVVYNDESYGIIRHRQHLEFGRTTASEYESPAFDEIARGFGAEAAVVRSVDDLDVVDEFLAADIDRPLLLDARTMPGISRPGFPPY